MEIKPITIAGCGPGALEYVTPAALRAIEAAEVLVGARRLLENFPQSAATRIPVGADVPAALDAMAGHVGKRRIVVLVTGDPGLCSLARPVIRRFGADACRVIPGISSVQAAFASVGVEWFGARILSAHDHAPDLDPASLRGEERLAVLAGNPANAAWVDALAAALLPTHAIYVCENLTLPDESVRRADPLLLPMNLASRSILVFVKKEATR
ncbi:MAG: precorrin-6y C5,15-methyltransferase (decarboxylating) subunit CbiE [Chthoniobacteraceae bacterium]|nr:precorrin-6y C5,15-methyltransferase (decarboxylating) subunit CbiE [Chthoniobacteraceae bacterium]